MEHFEMAFKDNDDQITLADSLNMEHFEMAFEDIDDQVTPADSINMKHYFEMAVEDNDDQVAPVDSNNIKLFEFAAGDIYEGILADSDNKAEIRVEDQNGILIPLINMLNEPEFIDEIYYLAEFPSTDVILPVWNCSPRNVIEYLTRVHDKPYSKTYALSRIYYKYNINDINGPITRECVFTDDMTLVHDIIIICYLNCLEPQDLNLPGIHHLFFMMEDKYKIVSAGTIYEPLSPFIITWSRIIYSFPSITMAYTKSSSSDLHIHMDFSICTARQRMIWCYLIISVLPILESNIFPLAYITAIRIKIIKMLHEYNIPFSTETRLVEIYETIMSFCRSKAFPEFLKFFLCERWNIIQFVEQHNQFKYADSFEQLYPANKRYLIDVESQMQNGLCNFLLP